MRSPAINRSALLLGAFLGIALSVLFLQQSTPPASAHFAWRFYDGEWADQSTPQAGNLQYWLDGTASYRAATESDIVHAAGQWNSVPNADWDFLSFSGFNNNIVYTTPCTTGANLTTTVVSSSQAGGLADAPVCGGQNNAAITRGVVRLSIRSDWKKGGGSVPSNKYDLRGVLVHELGHVTGFGQHAKTDHFVEADTPCAAGAFDPSYATMCAFVGIGTDHTRTLETHDEHTFKNAYPS